MASVSVRIPADKHARLRDIAETRNEPIGQVISQMVDEIEEQRFWEEARRSIAAAMADPKIRKEMEEEQRIYDGALMDGLEPETWPDE